MKFLPHLIGLFITCAVGRAQDVESWQSLPTPSLQEVVDRFSLAPAVSAEGEEAEVPLEGPLEEVPAPPIAQLLTTPTVTPGGNDADTITPEILNLARGLRYDPTMIFAFVRNHVDYEPYYGCKKGAHLTLLEMGGNDMDQSALLVALLRASGYSPQYRSGPVAFFPNQHILWNGISPRPFPDISDSAFAAAIGMSPTDPQLANERVYYGLAAYLTPFGFPIVERVNVAGTRAFGIPHVWVQLTVGGVTYQLSPSYKLYDWPAGINLTAATGISKSQLLADSNAQSDPTDPNGVNWVSNLDYDALSTRLSSYTTAFLNHIRAEHDSLEVEALYPHKKLIQKPISTLADADPLIPYNSSWATSETWTSTTIPTSRMSTLTVTAGDFNSGTGAFTTTRFNRTVEFPELRGQKLSLAFSSTTATFRLDEATFGTAFTLPAANTTVRLATTHDHYRWTWNATTSTWQKASIGWSNQSTVAAYTRDDAYAYAFPYCFENPQRLLRARQDILARYKRNNIADNDWRVRTETLNVLGLEWYAQTWRIQRIITSLGAGASVFAQRVGRVCQEGSYYIDVVGQGVACQNRDLLDAQSRNILRGSTLYWSAMEHGVIEQLQGPSAAAVSTVGVIHHANEDNQRLYRATSSNWSSISSQFTGYSSLTPISNAITNGAIGLIPKKGNNQVGDWLGSGYALYSPSGAEMKISGNLNGGYSIFPGEAGSLFLIVWGNADPGWASSVANAISVAYTPDTTPQQASADPVDLLSGAFFIDRVDLTVGGEGPRGLDFSRHYNSHLRHDSSSGLGFGWTHGNHIRLVERSSTRAALGDTNTYQAAPLVVASLATGLLQFEHTTAKEWATAALVTHWGVEQMKQNAVAIMIGNKTLEFIKMPDGTYVSPPGVKMTLTRTGATQYVLTKRHSYSILFDAGKALAITNPDGSQKTFTYSGEELQTVTDEFGRTLTYNWTSGRIAGVSDSTSRSIGFSYTDGNLTAYTDPEGKSWNYRYDADRRMDQLKDPLNRVITENYYDSENRVTRQRSMGDANKEWSFTWSGFINVEENPLGDLTSYAYDHRGRSIVVTNPLNEYTITDYDGQDRAYYSETAKGEASFSFWDADNNLWATLDPDEHSTFYFYDSELRLEESWDKEGNATTYTYTSDHKIEAVTDPLLNAVSYSYDDNGLLEMVTDPEEKTTSYEYDDFGAVDKVIHHDNTFDTFLNNARGDVLEAYDGESRKTTFTYNNRRQLLTKTLPAVAGEPSAVFRSTYDDAGNLATSVDANDNTTSYTYNSLGKSITTTIPAVPAGNNVFTTTYDRRDWPTVVANSLGHTATTEYDEVGRAVAVIDSLSRRTENTYDLNGRLIETKDPLSRVAKNVWSNRGERSRSTDPMTQHVDRVFDKDGRQTHLTNRRGKTYVTNFDDVGRAYRTTTPTGKVTQTTFYDNSQVETIEEPSGQTTSLSYNDRSLVESKTDPIGTISYTYDDSGLPETITEGTAEISRVYDTRGRLETFINSDGDEIGYRYDANGNLTRLIYPDGKEVSYTYNARNQLSTVTDWASRVTSYQYDRLGRLTETNRAYNGTQSTAAYDIAGQTMERRELNNGKLLTYIRFGYDAAGQINRRFRAPLVYSGWEHPSVTATHDNDNRLLTVEGQNVSHDADGNMTLGPITSESGFIGLTYNARNQLTNADGVTYSYDAEGRRRTSVSSSGTTRDVIDPNGPSKILVRHHPGGRKTLFVYGAGLLYEVSDSEIGEITKTHHYDQVGSTILRTDDAGNQIGWADYSAYGHVARKSGDMATPFLYNGQWGVTTESNGLLHMRARYYSPYLMRFLNADPIGFSGGMNWFAYADGNPISAGDPFGLSASVLDAANAGSGWLLDGIFNNVRGILTLGPWLGDQGHNVINFIGHPSFATLGQIGTTNYNSGIIESIQSENNYYAKQGAYSLESDNAQVAAQWRDIMVGVGAATIKAPTLPVVTSTTTAERQILYHYTNEAGHAGILESNQLNPSLRAVNPNDVRYGNGQYLSDITPGTRTTAQLSRAFINQPFQGQKFSYYIEIDVTGLGAIEGRPGVWVIPNEAPLNLKGRVLSSGAQ